jgi:Arylsulfatase A and related enzymes
VRYEELGGPDSMGSIGPEWASVSNAPFRLYKFSSGDGGLRVPLVISGPGIAQTGHQAGLAHMADLMPTLLEAAGVTHDPQAYYGRSQMPALRGETDAVRGPEDSIAVEVSGNVAVLRGDWKLTRVAEPFGDGTWQLYDMATDPGEARDVAAAHPDIVDALKAEYAAYSAQVGVVELGPDESAPKQLLRNLARKSLALYWPLLVGLLAGLAGVVALAVWAVRALRRPRAV